MSNLDIEVPVTDVASKAFEGGPFAGRMGVFISIGDAQKERKIRAFDSQFEGWGWMDWLRNGQAYLCVRGDNPLDAEDRSPGTPVDPTEKKREDGVVAFLDHFPARKRICNTYAFRTPTDAVDDRIDHYQVRITRNRLKNVYKGEDEKLQWYADQSRLGRVDFIIETKVHNDWKKVESFSSRYVTPDDRIWVWPTEDIVTAEKTAKSAGTNVALRTDYGQGD